MPLLAAIFTGAMFLILAAKPSIGRKKPGQAFSEERLKRDWIEIGIIKYGNMVRALPVIDMSYSSNPSR